VQLLAEDSNFIVFSCVRLLASEHIHPGGFDICLELLVHQSAALKIFIYRKW